MEKIPAEARPHDLASRPAARGTCLQPASIMTKDLFDKIVDLLLPEMDDVYIRKTLVQKALHGSSVLQKIQWDGAAQAFAVHLVNHLDQYGEISPGTPALAALLEEVKTLAGTNRQAEVDRLLAQLKALPASTECVGADSRAMPKALQA